MDIIFETDNGRRFKREIWFFSTIREVKENLHKFLGFPVSRQIFFFNGTIMEDERDLEYYDIIQDSVILLRFQPEPEPEPEPKPKASIGNNTTMKVTVLVPRVAMGKKKLELEVNILDKVGELRNELLRMKEQSSSFYFPVEGFFFIYDGTVMEEDKPFSCYGLKAGGLIEVFTGNVTKEHAY